MTSEDLRSSAEEAIAKEAERLQIVFSELSDDNLWLAVKRSHINEQGNREELIDRLIRFDLRRIYGSKAASWDPVADSHESRRSHRYSLEESEVLELTTENSEEDRAAQDKGGEQVPLGVSTPPIYSRPSNIVSGGGIDNTLGSNREEINLSISRLGTNRQQNSVRFAETETAQSRDNRVNDQENSDNRSNSRRLIRVDNVETNLIGFPETENLETSGRRTRSLENTNAPDSHLAGAGVANSTRTSGFGNFPMVPPFAGNPYMNPYFPFIPQYAMFLPYNQGLNVNAEPFSFNQTSQNSDNGRHQTTQNPWSESTQPFYPSYGPSNPSLDNTYQREIRTCNLLQRWKVTFAGEPREDVEEFIERLRECQDCHNIPDRDILKMIPAMFTGSARYWVRPLYRSWTTLGELFEAMRLQYGIPDFQLRLDDEIRSRTQAPDESISTYLSGLRLLMDKIVPRMSLREQLDRAYRNLHPTYLRSISREQFASFQELQRLGQQEEVRKERERAYRPPPPAEKALFPAGAYKPVSKSRNNTKNNQSSDQKEIEEVAAVDNSSNKKTQNNKSNKKPSSPGNQTGNKNNKNSSSNSAQTNKNVVKAEVNDNTSNENKTATGEKGSWPKGCWVCKEDGHWAKNCPNKTGVVCYRCGTPDVILTNCPNCNKGESQGNDQEGGQ